MYWTNAAIDVLLFFFVIVCLFMCLVVLMQRSKQEGLGAAFGGGFTESVWGAQTSQVLVKATVWLAVLFFVLSIALARLYSHRDELQKQMSPAQQELLQPVPSPAKPASAVVPTAMTPAPPVPSPNTVPATTTPATTPAPAPGSATPSGPTTPAK